MHNMSGQTLYLFTQSIEYLVRLCNSMKRKDVITDVYNTLLIGRLKNPLNYIHSLT